MLDQLVNLSASPWTYALVFAFAAGDVIAPILPSETLVVAASALAATGRLSFVLVLLCAAAGALAGDNVAYLVGRAFAGRTERWLASREKSRQRLAWAERQLERRGGTVIVVARFIPGGRTVTMLAAGLVAVRWPRFLGFDLAAAAIWALYSGLIGFFGGRAFEDEPLIGIAFAIGLALVLTVIAEGVRRLHARSRPTSDKLP